VRSREPSSATSARPTYGRPGDEGSGLDEFAASIVGTDWETYRREGPGVSAFTLEDGVVYHTYSAYAEDWTASGACTSGSTAHHAAAMKPASGTAATTSTTASETKDTQR
jgi:hypothetical protein